MQHTHRIIITHIKLHKQNIKHIHIIPADKFITERGGFVGVEFGHGILGNVYRKSMLLDNAIYFPEDCFYEDDYWYVLSMHYINSAYIIGEDFYHYYLRPDSTIVFIYAPALPFNIRITNGLSR